VDSGPVGVFFDLPAVTQQQYDSLMQELEVAAGPPAGGLLHMAGPHPDGGWLIIDVWESADSFERFATERLLPTARALGISPVRPRVFPIHDLLARTPQLGQTAVGSDFAEAVSALARGHARPRT